MVDIKLAAIIWLIQDAERLASERVTEAELLFDDAGQDACGSGLSWALHDAEAIYDKLVELRVDLQAELRGLDG